MSGFVERLRPGPFNPVNPGDWSRMSYLAIARKYRPTTFDEIVGQDHVTRTLRNAIRSDRVHHAFLFCGARGVGKTTAARALARAMNCQQGPTPEPCGTCTSCVEITSGTSPDLIEIDGASNNSVDDIRELRETVHYAPTQGRSKIYLIDEVHMLSKAAFNALLKTLEEPPPHVIFIFATTEPNKILDTILSRVQRFDFKRIPIAAVVGRLRELTTSEGAQISDNALKMIARSGEGSMRDAESLLDKVISFSADHKVSDDEVAETLGLIDRSLLYNTLEGIVEGDPAKCLKAIATVYDYGYELSQFTIEMLEVLRNATFVRLSPEARKYVDISVDELERLEALVADVDPEVLNRTFAALLEVHDQVSRASRPRVVLEMAIARLATKRPLQPVSALLSRLEDLERRLRHGGGGSSGGGGMRRSGGPKPPSRGADSGGRRMSSQTPVKPTPQPKVAPPPKPVAPTPRPPEPPQASARPEPQPREQPRPEPPPNPWDAMSMALRKLGRPADRLAQGVGVFRDGKLRISLPAGRTLAEGRRAREQAAVLDVLTRHYPPGTRIEVVPMAGTGTSADMQAALQREVLEDAAMRRVIDGLGGKLETATSLRDNGDSDGPV